MRDHRSAVDNVRDPLILSAQLLSLSLQNNHAKTKKNTKFKSQSGKFLKPMYSYGESMRRKWETGTEEDNGDELGGVRRG